MPAKAPCVEVAEAVLEQTRVVRIANLMRELAAPMPDAKETEHRGPAETKVAQAKPSRKELRLAKLQELRVAKLRPSVKDLRGRVQMAEAKPGKLEAGSSAKRKRWIKMAQNAKKPAKAEVKLAAKTQPNLPLKTPEVVAPAKVAHGASSKPDAKPDTTRHRHRIVRRTRFAYSGDNRLH